MTKIECFRQICQRSTKNIFGFNCFLPLLPHGKKAMLEIESLSKATPVLKQKLIYERCYLVAQQLFENFGDDRQNTHWSVVFFRTSVSLSKDRCNVSMF